MTFDQLWPPLIVMGLGLLIIGLALFAYRTVTASDEDSLIIGCLPVVLAVLGVILLWNGADVLVGELGR